jgi:hypothetical protein
MTAPQPGRSRWLYGSLFIVVLAATVLAYFGFRAQARLASQLREQALGQGLVVAVGRAEHDLFAIEFHDVTLRFRHAPGISAFLPRVTVDGALFGRPRVAIDEARFVLEGEPNALYQSLLALPGWQGVPLTWPRIDVEYSQRTLGKMSFEAVRFERWERGLVIRAGLAKLGPASARDVVLSLDKRNELIEVGLGEPLGKTAPTQLGYFGSNHGASEWVLSVRHQPPKTLLQPLGWEVGASFDESRAVVSASLIVPDDRARETRGNLELVLDHWPKPAWSEASALLGDTAAFVAHVERPEQGSSWDLQPVSLSLSLFTLTGKGRLLWGEKPSISLDVAGKLTCAQLRGNLPASSYLDQVRKYLAPDPRVAAPVASARLHEEVELRLHLLADRAPQGKREALWHLAAGCGLAELDSASSP